MKDTSVIIPFFVKFGYSILYPLPQKKCAVCTISVYLQVFEIKWEPYLSLSLMVLRISCTDSEDVILTAPCSCLCFPLAPTVSVGVSRSQ